MTEATPQLPDEATATAMTGSPALDRVLGGGLTPGSTYVIAGSPGSGKTILAQQLAFALATPERPARYYATLSEPKTKLVRHLSRFDFFDREALGSRVSYLNALSIDEGGDLETVVDRLSEEALRLPASLVVIDSAKALFERSAHDRSRELVYRLSSRISHSGAILLLVGEYGPSELEQSPEFAVADGILELARTSTGPVDRRWLRVVKMRGRADLQGQHTFTISPSGCDLYPRLETIAPTDLTPTDGRHSLGVDELDRLAGGGLPQGNATVLMGPAGVGKTALAMSFAHAGGAAGEDVIFVTTEETRSELLARADALGVPLRDGIEVMAVPVMGLEIDEFGGQLSRRVDELRPARVVIDGLASLIGPAIAADRFPSYLTALTNMLRRHGASVLYTFEISMLSSAGRIDALSHLFQNVVLLRYLEHQGTLARVINVLKMRHSSHDISLLQYDIGPGGLVPTGPAPVARGLLGWNLSAVD